MHAVLVTMPDDPGGGARFFHHLVAAGHRAAQGAANANVRLSRRRLPKHRIEGDELENVDRLQIEFRRDPAHAFIADESEFLLPQMQQRHRGAAFPISRIAPDRFIHFPLQSAEMRVFVGSTETTRYSDNVLTFDCTLSSLKTIVTDSLP